MTTTNDSTTLPEKDKVTELRKTLEKIDTEIHNAWLKDTDKVVEFTNLNNILSEILKRDRIEEQFENTLDFQYFMSKFSKQVIHNTLQQSVVFGENGDSVAYETLLSYLRILIKFQKKPEYIQLWESIKEIFDNTKSFYRNLHNKNSKISKEMNERRLTTMENFNDSFLVTKKKKELLEVQKGDFLDVQIDNKVTNPGFEKKVWTRGVVRSVDASLLEIEIAEENDVIRIFRNSSDYAPVGTYTKDYDWKNSLEECIYSIFI